MSPTAHQYRSMSSSWQAWLIQLTVFYSLNDSVISYYSHYSDHIVIIVFLLLSFHLLLRHFTVPSAVIIAIHEHVCLSVFPSVTLWNTKLSTTDGFYKAVWLYKLHQNVWQWVSGLCPDPLGSPREGREERRIDRGREVAWTLPPRFMTDRRHCRGNGAERIQGWSQAYGRYSLGRKRCWSW